MAPPRKSARAPRARLALRLLLPLALLASLRGARADAGGAPGVVVVVDDDGGDAPRGDAAVEEGGFARAGDSLRARVELLTDRYRRYSSDAAARYAASMDPASLREWVDDARAAAAKVASPEVRRAMNDMYRPVFYPDERDEDRAAYDDDDDGYDDDGYDDGYYDGDGYYDDDTAGDDDDDTAGDASFFQRWAPRRIFSRRPDDDAAENVVGETILDAMRLAARGAKLAAPSAVKHVGDAAGAARDAGFAAASASASNEGGILRLSDLTGESRNAPTHPAAFATDGGGGTVHRSFPLSSSDDDGSDWEVSAVNALRAGERAAAAARAVYEDNVSEEHRVEAEAFARRFVSEALQRTVEMQARAPTWSVPVDPTGVASVRASAFLDNLRVARQIALERQTAKVGGNEDARWGTTGALGGRDVDAASFERAVVSELRALEAVEAVEAVAKGEEKKS
jgi:hypothetical protein